MGSRRLDCRLPLCESRQSICQLQFKAVQAKTEVGIRDADFHCSKVGIPYADFTIHLPPHAKLQKKQRGRHGLRRTAALPGGGRHLQHGLLTSPHRLPLAGSGGGDLTRRPACSSGGSWQQQQQAVGSGVGDGSRRRRPPSDVYKREKIQSQRGEPVGSSG